jgi:hypothetical protein
MPAIFIELQESQREGGRPDTPLTPSPQKRVVAFQIRERLKTLQKAEDIHQNVQKIRKEIQQAYQPFAGTVKRTGEAFRMELVLRPLITTSISNQLQQAIIDVRFGLSWSSSEILILVCGVSRQQEG